MTLEQLDVVRGWCIAAVIVSLVMSGLLSKLSSRPSQLFGIAAQLFGGSAGLILFAILNFVAGWDAYFATKASDQPIPGYQGRHGAAARVIERLGEMEASWLGIVFGIVGLALIVQAIVNMRALKIPRNRLS